jgi:hypothetical protein
MNEVSEETIAKVLSMLPKHHMVDQLWKTGEFDSTDAIYAALHVLKARGKVVAVDPIYGPTKRLSEPRRPYLLGQGNAFSNAHSASNIVSR